VVGRSEPGCDLGSALSFKDLRHPGWGGGRAEPELYLLHGSAGHLLPQHSRERALTGLAGGPDFDNAGLVGGERHQLQRVGLAGSAGLVRLPVSPPTVRAVVAPCAPRDRPRRRALLGRRSCFWGCPAFAPVRRLCAEVGASLVREDPSGNLPVGRWFPSSALRWRRLKKSSPPTGSPPPCVLRASGSLALIACPRPSSGGVGEELVAVASALRSSLLLFGHFRAGVGEPPGVLLPRRPSVGGCSYLRGWNRSSICNGTLSAGVCSLWLSGPEHVCIFWREAVFFPHSERYDSPVS
jgi:hypothetical protein